MSLASEMSTDRIYRGGVTTQPTLPQVAFTGLGIRTFARSERFARYYRLNLREGE